MASVSIPISLFLKFKDLHGEVLAKEYFEVYEAAQQNLSETVAKDVVQKKLELKDELSKELVSKADLKAEIAHLENKIDKVDSKHTLYFFIIIATIVLFNKDSLTFLAQIFGLIK